MEIRGGCHLLATDLVVTLAHDTTHFEDTLSPYGGWGSLNIHNTIEK